jgi:hypothetical protein
LTRPGPASNSRPTFERDRFDDGQRRGRHAETSPEADPTSAYRGHPSARHRVPAFVSSRLIELVDLLMLNVKAPLADAVRATVCRRWREAADLWLDVDREPVFRPLSAHCGLEAALNAGLYDLAQYFHVRFVEAPPLPDFLVEPWRQSMPIRRDRARYHSACAHKCSSVDARRSVQRLVGLRLYREAIRETFRRRLFKFNRGAAVPLLAECYARLGEYEALIALHRSQRPYFAVPNARALLHGAGACLAREQLGLVENALEFARHHPAGHLLAPLLNAPRPGVTHHE